MDDRRDVEQVLAASLTAEDTGLIPFLPYLLQDLWELGGSPAVAAELLRGRLAPGDGVLDLACGKGAVSVRLAQVLGLRVKGVDLLEPFVQEAREKAEEHGVGALCSFEAGDANAAAAAERGWDCVVFSAAGTVLGPPPEMLKKLAACVRGGGYVLLDESYLPDDAAGEMRYNNYEMHPKARWDEWFRAAGLAELDCREADDGQEERNDSDLAAIERRAAELSARHPDKAALFEGYVKSQQDEVYDIENALVNVVWLLQKQG